MRSIAILGLLGVSACMPVASDDALCGALGGRIDGLAEALIAHPETPDPVGEAGTDVVLGFEGGCNER